MHYSYFLSSLLSVIAISSCAVQGYPYKSTPQNHQHNAHISATPLSGPLTETEKQAAALFKRLIDLKQETRLSMSCFFTHLIEIMAKDDNYKSLIVQLKSLINEQSPLIIGKKLSALLERLTPAAQAEWKKIKPKNDPDNTKLGMIIRERAKKNGKTPCKPFKDEL